MATTIETVTLHQIRMLQAEAQLAGDYEQAALCEDAEYCLENDYDRDRPAVRACVDAINNAEVQS